MATIIDDERHHELAADLGERMVVAPADFAAATGWLLKPEGLCREDVCVPVRDRSRLVVGDGIDVEAAAAALGRPAVVDPRRGVAAFGAPAYEVADAMRSLDAPDFTLPDIDGRPVSLHDYDRRKRLLLAWSSW